MSFVDFRNVWLAYNDELLAQSKAPELRDCPASKLPNECTPSSMTTWTSELATVAAKVGIERFVLDDGWFHGRHDDTSSLGDWWPDETKFPKGLGDLIAHVRGLGMGFGLWFEPEMVNPNSELFRAHPDWALQVAGRPLLTARNQLVLDISRPEASDYLFEKISALLGAHPIEYIKWDHNRDLTSAGLANGSAGYRAQVYGGCCANLKNAACR